ncbi:MAG: DUF1016 N-terminal domain-containing protein, partial [Candidatus Margulisiibacteriota bacterium]
MGENVNHDVQSQQLFENIKQLIEQSKQQLAVAVNATMSMLYWQIGTKINTEIKAYSHSESYGKKIVATLWRQLALEYGASFSEKNLRRMMQFAETFPDEKIVVSLIRQLSWTHLLAVISIENPLKREFYIEMCKLEHWSVRTFRERIKSMLFERTAISKKPEKPIQLGLILCAGKNEEHVELMQLDRSNIRVADYLTVLPPQKLL